MTRALVAITLVLLVVPSAATAQRQDSLPGLRTAAFRRDTLRVNLPAAFLGAGRLAPTRVAPAELARRWADSIAVRIASRAALRWRTGLLGESASAGPPADLLPVVAPGDAPFGGDARLRGASVLRQYADLGLQMNARFEARMDRLRNLRCTAADATQIGSGCRGGFNPPRMEPQFSVRAGGVVGQRVHVNVDYDSEREFEASNNIQLYYQGLDDEVLRRAQVGNVTFSAPSSRFITGGIPSNNFGAQFEGQLGALNFGAIFAQQKGNVVRGRVFTIGDRTVQPLDREVMDRDYEPLRFFFVVDPATLPAYPAVDLLTVGTQALPAAAQVREVRLYRRRASTGRGNAEQNLTGIEAVALRDDGLQRAGPFVWELLTEGREYYLDNSGLWFALANRLDQSDYLAVSYITADDDTVGTFPAQAVAGRTDTLRLIYEPQRGAEVPTFRYEVRSAYRVGGVDDVVRESMALSILVAESERPLASGPTFLSLLGLGQETDATRFDQFNRLFPRQQDPGRGAPLRDYFIIFPHLTPFADSTRLPPQFRTDSLYRTPTYLLRSNGPTPLFQLRLRYDATGGDDRRLLSLGGFQIREGSERITAGGRQLVRGQDYRVNYEIGQVTFLQPDSLFRQPTSVSVQYEENPAFAIAPTSIYGLSGRYDLGDHGTVDVVGLLQRERTTYTRPPLGFEPSSNFIGGVAGSFRFEPQRVTRLLDALPLVRTEARSTLTLDAEIATSRPSPNQLGVAYVETFEDEAGSFISLGEDQWEYGSRPGSADRLGVTGIDATTGFADGDAVVLTWQNLFASQGGTVQFRARDIDPSIRVQGVGESFETILWMELHGDTAGGLVNPATLRSRWTLPHTPGPRWRSMSQSLSSTGVDLTRVEFLEFWVYEDSARGARDGGMSLVFDFGTVFEDAVAFQPTGFRVVGGDTVYSGRRRAGEGRLDTERDTLTHAFNAAINDVGILGDVADTIRNLDADTLVRNMPLCRSEVGEAFVVYDWGNLLGHCTRRNGRADTEDLNNDQHLDTLIAAPAEDHLRYVFRVGDDRFYVRDGGTTPGGARWRLYRIPFRGPDTIQVGTPDLRQIRAVRLTVIAPEPVGAERPLFVGLSRVKLVGAPWVKRAATPVAGLSGGIGAPHGEVIASVVSTENFGDLGYEPPPGVSDQGASRGGQFQVGATQINERSLRLLGSDVRSGERAEAFLRFAEGERNFLGYRQLRAWARGRGPGWDNRQLAFYIKVAQDEHNFYLYRQPLRTATWEPEVVVDFSRWLDLRARIETRYLLDLNAPPDSVRARLVRDARACGADTLNLAYLACDTAAGYLVHVRNPGVAPPNLTRVQELAVGFLRDSGQALDSAELWVDDIRLSQVVDDPGYAGAVTVRLSAADVADMDLSLTRRDRNFRQLGEDPTYVTANQLTMGATVRLERFGLDRLGVTAPFTTRVDRSTTDPYYLHRTDVLAGGLDGLRRPEAENTNYSLSLRRTRRGSLWWQRAFTDNLAFSGSRSSGHSTTQLSSGTSRLSDLRTDYLVQPGSRSVRYVPGFVRSLLGGLPGFVRRTDLVRGLESGRMRWTPASLQFSTQLTRAESEYTAFRVPIVTEADTASRSVRVASAALRSRAQLDLRPFAAAALGATLASERDLRDYGDTTTIGRLARSGRREFLGAGIGFERSRQLATRLSYNPALVSWLRPRFAMTSGFSLNRDPNAAEPERSDGDSAGEYRLPTTFTNSHSRDLAAALELSRLLSGLFGDSSLARRLLDRVSQLDASRHTERRSQFNRPGFDPGLRYQLGLGGRDAFLRQGDRLAASATELREERLSSGVRLPLAVTLTASWVSRSTIQWLRRGDAQAEVRTTDTDWPNLTGRWLVTPRGRFGRVVSSVNATAGLRQRTSHSVQPALGGGPAGDAGGVSSARETRSVPLSVSVSWAGRIVTNLSASSERTRLERTGNLTLNDGGQVSADVAFAFRVPPEIVPLRSEVRTTLRYLATTSTSCVRRAGGEDCVPIADSRHSEYTLLLDTDTSPNVSAGLSASYVLTEDAHANRKFSQFVITAAVRVVFQAGTAR